MKHNLMLTITSLLSIVLFSLHLTQDIVVGIEPGSRQNLIGGVLILTVWLVGTLLLAERPLGSVILILGSILAAGVPVLHFSGRGVGRIAKLSGGFLFVWTLHALAITGLFSLILIMRGLWSRRKGQTR